MFHRNAEEGIGKLHCPFVMSNDNNLRIFSDNLQQIIEAENIGFVQRRIYFVQQAEGGRLYQKNRENKSYS